MTVKELIVELKKAPDQDAQVIITNVRDTPFAVLSIKEVKTSDIGLPIYLRAKRNDSD